MTHEGIVDQPMKSAPYLPFEVIAVPQYDSQLVNSSNYNLTDPINIKIRIRNKEEKGEKYGIVSSPKLSGNNGKKVRLVSSDQTIMSFDLVVEPETSKKYQKKSHKNFLHYFKPGGCLRTQNCNNDKSSYQPSVIPDVSKVKSTCSIIATDIISEKIVLKKNFPPISCTERTGKHSKPFIGKCKPGGCLDPPFDEDKYSYGPALKLSTTNLPTNNYKNEDKKSLSPDMTSLNKDSDVQMETKEKIENIRKLELDDNLHKEDYEHSLITYPTSSPSNDFRKHNESYDMKLRSRLNSGNKARNSINEFSEIFFMPPKKGKTRKMEENLNETVFMKEKTDIDIKKSNDSLLKQQLLESPVAISESKDLINKKVDEAKVMIGNSYLITDINSVDKKIQNKPKKSKSIESIQNIKSIDGILYSMNADTNANLKTSSQDLINITKTKDLTFENNVSSSQNSFLCLEGIINETVQGKESKELEIFLENKETNPNRSEETNKEDYKDYIKSPSLKNIVIQKSNSNNIGIPGNKTKDLVYSFSESIKTLIKEHIEVAEMEKIKRPSLQNKELQSSDLYSNTDIPNLTTETKKQSINESQGLFKQELDEKTDIDETKAIINNEMEKVDFKNRMDYTVIDTKEFKDSHLKESQESFEKQNEDITKTAEIKAKHVKNRGNSYTNDITNDDVIQANESQYSQKSQETSLRNSVDITSLTEGTSKQIISEEVDENNRMSNKNTDHIFVQAEEKTLTLALNEQDNNFETYQNLENIFPDDYQTELSVDKISAIAPDEKLNLLDTSNQELDKESFDKNITDSNLISNNTIIHSNNEPIRISSTELPERASEVNSVRQQMSSIILTRDETGGKYLSVIDETRKDNESEKLEHSSSSKSVSNAFDSNIIINDGRETFDGTYKTENSVIHEKLDSLEDQPINIIAKSSANINEYRNNNNNYQSDSIATNKGYEDYAKTIDLYNLEHSQNNSLKRNQPNVLEQAGAVTYSKLNPDFDATTYDSIAIDFGFRYYVDNGGKLVIHTVDTSTPLNKDVVDNTTIIKSMVRTNGDEIRIPINFDTDLSLEIKNKKLSEVPTSYMQHKYEKKTIERESTKNVVKDELLQETLNSVYKNLIPLNMMIQNLKDETSSLSHQQTSIKDILEIMEKKPMRLIHTNGLCDCRKKQ